MQHLFFLDFVVVVSRNHRIIKRCGWGLLGALGWEVISKK